MNNNEEFVVSFKVNDKECLCNTGVQECPAHPGRLKTKEEKIEFRKQWDRRVER